jgi:hypothetical protein
MGVQKGKSGAIHSHINIKKLVSAVNCIAHISLGYASILWKQFHLISNNFWTMTGR